MPEHLVDKSLTANQERARFVARDAYQYTRSVPAGRVIRASELRTVLTAKEEGEVHTETVDRVIRLLDDLGGDHVEVKQPQGQERVLVFADELVKRIVAWSNHTDVIVTGAKT